MIEICLKYDARHYMSKVMSTVYFWYGFYNCDVIKQNESEFANIGLEICQTKEINPFVFFCLNNLSIGYNFRMTSPIVMGFSAKRSYLNGE